MTDEKELRQSLQKLAGLVRELEEIADPKARAAARQVVQTLMDVHGAAIEKILERIFQAGDTGLRVIDELGADPLVAGLLVLYGLHPEDSETRVVKAFEKIAPQLSAQGVASELISIKDNQVRVRVAVGAHSCGSTAAKVRALLEEAVYEAAPDVSLMIEGLDGKPASGFVSLEKLLASEVAVVPAGLGAQSKAEITEVSRR
jgi:Fe-S cluster biogenesis protein NfuA